MEKMTKLPNPTEIQHMKNRYEALLILDVKGKEESAKDTVERLEKAFAQEGASIEQVQRLDRRQFAYAAGKLDHGYYVNFIFSAEPTVIEKLQARFELDEDVYRQHYLRFKARKASAKAAA
jgi:small subunit ribosomal protein S6